MLFTGSCLAAIVLIALLADFFIHLLADFLNLSSLDKKLPVSFAGIYDSERYTKSQEYLKTNTTFGWLASGTSLIATLCFWFLKGFPYLDEYVRSLGSGPVLTGLTYMAILIALKSLLSLPFSIYHTFVIEEKYGFNNTTARTFITDLLKATLLGAVIGGVLLSGILWFFEYAGENAWWLCWVSVILFSLVIQYVVPNWIMPLFNKFTPLKEGQLRSAVMNYANSIEFSLTNIFVMDGSKRSAKSNAFFTGFGKNKRIALFDTLIEKHTTEELVAVIAHEMGHFKKKHILKSMITGFAQTGLMFFIMSLIISKQELFDAFFMPDRSIYAGLIFFSLLYSPMDFISGLILSHNSRKNEYEADRFAARTTGSTKQLTSALKKLSVDNLSNLTPHPFYVFVNYSHPPVLERISALEATDLETASQD